MNLYIKLFLLLVAVLLISFRLMLSVEDKAIASLKNNSSENLQRDLVNLNRMNSLSYRNSSLQFEIVD